MKPGQDGGNQPEDRGRRNQSHVQPSFSHLSYRTPKLNKK
jgi:hypothetical protein